MDRGPHVPVSPAPARLEAWLRGRWPVRLIAAANIVLLTVAAAPFVLWETLGPQRFDDGLELGAVQLETLDIDTDTSAGATLSPSTQVTLMFSVGSRGLSDEEARRLRVDDPEERGADGLTDSIMLVVADTATGQAALLSIPRDLWLFDRGHRINATFNRHGIQAFVDDVGRVTGLPIHHVVQVNFGAAAQLVDAVGGVAMRVQAPTADLYSVLYVPEAGCWRFDGADALAWARSRHTLTRSGETWRVDASASDFGRIRRQQRLLAALWEQVRGPQLLPRIPDLLAVARDGLVVDDGLGVQEVRDLAGSFADVAAGRVEGFTLPTFGRRIAGAAAQVLDEEGAAPILERLRAWPPEPAPEPADTQALPLLAAPAGPGGLAVAAADADTLDVDLDCTLDVARDLPDPRAPLGGIAARMGPRAGASDTPDRETASPAPTGDDAGDPSPAPEPSSEPSDEPSSEPEPSPSDEPSDDDRIIDLPFGDR